MSCSTTSVPVCRADCHRRGVRRVCRSRRDGELSSAEAIARVHEYVLDRGLDTAGYPLAKLRVARCSVGWMVYAPVPRGEIAIGRAIFYVADDGVLEHSSLSMAPSIYRDGFEKRCRRRQSSLG